jgi:ribosomal-protein-alanine N-acetyltransferase
MAALHAAAFEESRGWSADEFRALLAGPGAFAVHEPGGFALARAVAGEAEVLTLAVAPVMRRQGIARRLLGALEAQARDLRAERVFLEVAEGNRAALGLYRTAGYVESGRRAGYYRLSGGIRHDAILMAKPLISA